MLHRVRMRSHLPQLRVPPGTLRKVGMLLDQGRHSCRSLKHCQVRGGGAQEPQGNSFLSTASCGRWQMERSSEGAKRQAILLIIRGISSGTECSFTPSFNVSSTDLQSTLHEKMLWSTKWKLGWGVWFVHFPSFSVVYCPLLLQLWYCILS